MSLLKEQIYQEIKQRIITCKLEPGSFIKETDFEKDLSVSRTPLREAFNKLEEEGLLKVIPKKGVQVKSLSLMSIAHTYEARLLLEPFILTNYWDTIEIEKMREIKLKSLDLIENKEPRVSDQYIRAFFSLDNQFHRLIGNSCNNEYLNKTLTEVDDEVQRVRMQLGHNSRYLESAREHIAVIDAIQGNDKEGAVAALAKHIKNSQNVALTSISHQDIDYKVF